MKLRITLTLNEDTFYDAEGNYNPCSVFELTDELLQKTLASHICIGNETAIEKDGINMVARALWVAG